jgi:hypothetical protein
MSPAMQSAILRGLVKERVDLRASMLTQAGRLADVEEQIIKVRMGEWPSTRDA